MMMKTFYSRTLSAVLINFIVFISCSGKDLPDIHPEGNGQIAMPTKEFRAVWMATVGKMDWPASFDVATQKQEYIQYLDLFEQYNINAVVVQIRPTADAFYPSNFEPWSEYIAGDRGCDPGYDVLQFMIEEAHKRNLEFHAWMNPFRITNNANTYKPILGYASDEHPEWTMRYGDLLMFRPALPEVRQHFLNVIKELITKYDVDGVHFDDYFYPYPSKGIEIDDAADYAKYGKGYSNIEDFRRGNVNQMIEAIHKLIVNEHPSILFGISPYAAWRHRSQDPNGSDTSGINNYDDLYADIRLWCERGWIDYVTPQLYASTQNIALNYIKLCEWWPANTFDVPVTVGYGLYRFGNPKEGDIYMDPKELETQFFYARRQSKIKGGFLFNASAFTANRIDIMNTVAKVYSNKSLVPFMGRKTVSDPNDITNLKRSGTIINWDVQATKTKYAVYKIEDNVAILLDVVKQNEYVLSEKGHYAVSAVNIDNVEGNLSEQILY